MSYDLFFHSRGAGTAITSAQLQAYFADRPNYEVTDHQAWYSNDDTGVYFSFEYGNNADKASEGPDAENPSATAACVFNLNYIRPHVFALEAEPEIRSLVEHFDLLVKDPQEGGMDDGTYSRAAFLTGWNQGNAFGCRTALTQLGRQADVLTLSAARLEQYWRWSFGRKEFQAKFGERVFVPRIMFIKVSGQVQSFVVWSDGFAAAIPEVDYLVVFRKVFAPRKFLRKKPDLTLLPYREAEHVLASFPRKERGLAYRLLEYVEPPANVREFVRGCQPIAGELDGVAVDEILDQELVDACSNA